MSEIDAINPVFVGTKLANELGFTPDKFFGYLWLSEGNVITISLIESVHEGQGNTRKLLDTLKERYDAVIVPVVVSARFDKVLKASGFKHVSEGELTVNGVHHECVEYIYSKDMIYKPLNENKLGRSDMNIMFNLADSIEEHGVDFDHKPNREFHDNSLVVESVLKSINEYDEDFVYSFIGDMISGILDKDAIEKCYLPKLKEFDKNVKIDVLKNYL
jgi:hypothetical protein